MVADSAWRAYLEGKVELCQRRDKMTRKLDYIAQLRRVVKPPKSSSSSFHRGNVKSENFGTCNTVIVY